MKLVLVLACLVGCTDSRSAPSAPTTPPAPAIAKVTPPAPAPTPVVAPTPTRAQILGVLDSMVPKRGVVVSVWGLAGSSQLVFDADAKTIVFDRVDMGSKKSQMKKNLDSKTRDELMTLATTTLTGPRPTWTQATDVRIDLAIADGPAALYVSAAGEYNTKSAVELTTRLWKLVR